MALGYDKKLFILAFDHRGSFQKKMFGIEGDPTPAETAKIIDAKSVIFDGFSHALGEPKTSGWLLVKCWRNVVSPAFTRAEAPGSGSRTS